jgi:teichuronic acid exporter
MPETLKEKTAKGLFWGIMNSGSTQVINVVFGIFVGRILCPADYGVVAVLTIFTLIAGNLQSSGFSQGLVNLKNPTDRDYNSVFWFNVIVSLAVYSILFASAPLIAGYLHQPCLVEVSRLVFLGFVISAFGIAHSAYMTRNMMNKEIAISGFLAVVSSNVTGLALALHGMAYWSLAWQQIVYILVLNMGRYYYTKWHPAFRFDFAPIRGMFNFSVKILVTNIINTISNNILTFIFGRLFPIKDVGNYSQAYNWDTKANSFVSSAVGQIAQPVLAAVREERGQQVTVFRKMLRFTAFISFPVMFGLTSVSREFILITIHGQWIDSIPLLRVLCIGGAFIPLHTLYQNLAISNGRSDIYMKCNIVQLAFFMIIVYVCHHFSMFAMVCSYTVFTILWLLVWQCVAKRTIGLRSIDVAKDVFPFMVVSAAVMTATHYVTMGIQNLYLLLLSRVALAGILYVGSLKLLHAQILDECLQFVRRRRGSQPLR